MTQDELKLVLDALKWCHGGEPCGTAEAIAVVEEALAQHDSIQEKKSTLTPKFVRIIDGVTCIPLVEHEHIVNSLSQPEQEPVACPKNIVALGMPVNVPVTPPQRTWVGLTVDEIETIWRKVEAGDFHDCVLPFAEKLEVKLKEKNNG